MTITPSNNYMRTFASSNLGPIDLRVKQPDGTTKKVSMDANVSVELDDTIKAIKKTMKKARKTGKPIIMGHRLDITPLP